MKLIDKLFPYILVGGILLNANGLLLDILEPDGALYATISKHIALTGDWTNLFGDGHDWLDKPHFPFWVSALSFKIFGINAFAYKLPAFCFWLAGTWFTYKLTQDLYDPATAKISVIIYLFSLHGILNNFDVRAEPYLTALIIIAMYYMHRLSTSNHWTNLIIAAFATGCAIMTKGIFALITIGGGFVIYWVITRQWKQFVSYRWWLFVLLVFLFITPELYSLYTQFDLHPEKVVFGKTGVSGLRFFFWDSQFGRFFNTGPIKGNGDPTFFLHTTLWAFLPWSIILYIAVFNLVKKGKPNETTALRWIIYGSALITFLIFSFSGFQLPHYITILFPHFSIITAAYLVSLSSETTIKRLTILQVCLLFLATIAVCLLAFYSKMGNVAFAFIFSIGVAIATLPGIKQAGLSKMIVTGCAISLVLFVFLFNVFYPRLLQFQSGMVAGKYLKENKIYSKAATLNAWSYSFEFYAPGFVSYVNNVEDINNFVGRDSTAAFYTTPAVLPELTKKGYRFQVLKEFDDFHISMLTGAFLNPTTRQTQVEKRLLILLRKKAG